jgi:hypothetical protein
MSAIRDFASGGEQCPQFYGHLLLAAGVAVLDQHTHDQGLARRFIHAGRHPFLKINSVKPKARPQNGSPSTPISIV